MIFAHPITLSIALLDLFTCLLIVYGGKNSFFIIHKWHYASQQPEQLVKERLVHVNSLIIYIAYISFMISSVLLIVAIAIILPDMVPGAMCGTGVLQAIPGSYKTFLLWRFSSLLLLHFVLTMQRINEFHPHLPLTQPVQKYFLIAAACVIASIFQTMRAINAIIIDNPVDCCNALYQLTNTSSTFTHISYFNNYFAISGVVFSLILIKKLLTKHYLEKPMTKYIFLVLLFIFPVLLYANYLFLINYATPYYYHVLQHHCPWCLFLPEHHAIGIVILLIAFLWIHYFFRHISIGFIYTIYQKDMPSTNLIPIQFISLIVFTSLWFLFIIGPKLLWYLDYGQSMY